MQRREQRGSLANAGWLVAGVLAACGPTTVVSDDTEGGDTTAAAESTAAASAEGGAGPTTDGADATGSTGPGDDAPVDSTGPGGSSEDESATTTGESILETTAPGSWLCEGGDRSFTLLVDTYEADPVPQLSGMVCAPYNEEPDPLDWAPCGSLTSHPTQVGADGVWIYAQVPPAPPQRGWTFSAMLFYDVLIDELSGMFSGPGEPREGNVRCTRLR